MNPDLASEYLTDTNVVSTIAINLIFYKNDATSNHSTTHAISISKFPTKERQIR
jgi:hypothetical protein